MIGVGIEVIVKGLTARFSQLTVQPTLRRHIINTQEKDHYFSKILQQRDFDRPGGFSMPIDKGLLWRGGYAYLKMKDQ